METIQDYSQGGEQAVIIKYFGACPVGNVLDIGAADGRTFSNSMALIEAGWGGVLVEPEPFLYKTLFELHNERPNVHCFNCAVGAETAILTFYKSVYDSTKGDSRLISTLKKEETKKWVDGGYKFEEEQVQVLSFKNFLEESPVKKFEFITIDTEGVELEILRQMDLKALGCRMICLEWNGEHKEEFDALVAPFGLELVLKTAENLIYAMP